MLSVFSKGAIKQTCRLVADTIPLMSKSNV